MSGVEPWQSWSSSIIRRIFRASCSLIPGFETATDTPELNRTPNYGNVFFSSRDCEPGQYRLLAMDHTHVFTEGSTLTRRLSNIGEVRDTRIYGRFSQFTPYLDPRQLARAAEDLKGLDPNLIARVVAAVPADWEVEADVREALREFLIQRARFVAGRWESLLPEPI
jgi:hypothetical protein